MKNKLDTRSLALSNGKNILISKRSLSATTVWK